MFTKVQFRTAIIAFCLAITAIGCSKDESSPTGTDNSNITSKYYAQINPNGKTVTWQADPFTNNPYDISMGLTGGGQGEGQGEYYAHEGFRFQRYKFANGTIEEDMSTPTISIEFGRLFYNGQPYKEEIEAVISKGPMPYGGMEMKKNGIEITYRDTQGKVWATSAGSADQTGSTFEVLEHTRVESGVANDISHFFTKVAFTCKVYDGSGNSMTITSGKAAGRTIRYYY